MTTRAEIRYLHTPDIDVEPDTHVPEDPANFVFLGPDDRRPARREVTEKLSRYGHHEFEDYQPV
jgi:hypothetical protein